MAALSDAWFSVFPAPRIPDVLAYVDGTWNWLRRTFAESVAFQHDEPTLTDNLCEALADRGRRLAHRMDCDFQSETWELRRAADGTTARQARADIRVILGAPGTPHLVIEFKKLDGTTNARWRYFFDGVNRFIEGKYAVGHAVGVMCGFSSPPFAGEAHSLADYIRLPRHAVQLVCITNSSGDVVTMPSAVAPANVSFDTHHSRPSQTLAEPIALLHMLLTCTKSVSPNPPVGLMLSRRPTDKLTKRKAGIRGPAHEPKL